MQEKRERESANTKKRNRKETETAHKRQNISENTTLQTNMDMVTPKTDTEKKSK